MRQDSDLGLADHVWQDKRAAIAKIVDDLGDQFRPAMRAGWLSYLRQTYPDNGAPAAGPPVGQGTLVTAWCSHNESIVLLFAANTNPV